MIPLFMTLFFGVTKATTEPSYLDQGIQHMQDPASRRFRLDPLQHVVIPLRVRQAASGRHERGGGKPPPLSAIHTGRGQCATTRRWRDSSRWSLSRISAK